eukprot:CAMPEP_0181291536 /NCGR_PEP_ID=MMETSP1101-20121128/2021_1 /TAXON_ID=46948 /ORGANISM="Rhodomonas abbreviata, Strain Caron Lab Isolate" /LENGTH=423 /DNA_ID=CAMNT_0023395937 /DNA_START=300 /DNA_END=1568 /DNA_ORIENTATION=-
MSGRNQQKQTAVRPRGQLDGPGGKSKAGEKGAVQDTADGSVSIFSSNDGLEALGPDGFSTGGKFPGRLNSSSGQSSFLGQDCPQFRKPMDSGGVVEGEWRMPNPSTISPHLQYSLPLAQTFQQGNMMHNASEDREASSLMHWLGSDLYHVALEDEDMATGALPGITGLASANDFRRDVFPARASSDRSAMPLPIGKIEPIGSSAKQQPAAANHSSSLSDSATWGRVEIPEQGAAQFQPFSQIGDDRNGRPGARHANNYQQQGSPLLTPVSPSEAAQPFTSKQQQQQQVRVTEAAGQGRGQRGRNGMTNGLHANRRQSSNQDPRRAPGAMEDPHRGGSGNGYAQQQAGIRAAEASKGLRVENHSQAQSAQQQQQRQNQTQTQSQNTHQQQPRVLPIVSQQVADSPSSSGEGKQPDSSQLSGAST